MQKADKKTKAQASATIQPWSCVHEEASSKIEAYTLATGKREILAEIYPMAGHSAQAMAELIVKAVNTLEHREHLINEMQAALQMCLETDGLNWAAEHDAETVLRRANRLA